MTLKQWIATIGLVVCTSSAYGADIKYYPASKSGVPIIAITGTIKNGDEKLFSDIAIGKSDAIVMLNSDGGMIEPAIRIGKAIKIQGYTTVVYSNDTCASACALIWMAGSRKMIFASGRVGFHASYQDIDGKLIEIGVGNALVGHYLSQLGYDENAVILATEAPPEKILWLTVENAKNSGISFEPISENSPSPPPPITFKVNSNDSPSTGLNERDVLGDAPTLGRSVKFFTNVLTKSGYKSDPDLSDPTNPKIYTGLDGKKVGLFFSGCANLSCNYLEIIGQWNDIERDDAYRAIKGFALSENFANIFYTEKNTTLSVYHYIILGRDGISAQNFIDNFEYFSKDMEAVKKIILQK